MAHVSFYEKEMLGGETTGYLPFHIVFANVCKVRWTFCACVMYALSSTLFKWKTKNQSEACVSLAVR